jgi:hypothetical protein
MKRDLTPTLFGLGLTALLSGTFVIAGLKAGITPGVNPSYALGSVKAGIHANLWPKSSLHLRGPIEPLEPPGKCQPEPVQQRFLLGLGLRHVAQSHRGPDAAG